METKIRVYGKDQNRTALGIVNAYLKLNPDTTLAELQKAFPYSLNPRGSVKQTVAAISEIAQKPGEFFDKQDELIKLKNGQKAALKYVWGKEDFENIKEHAKQFGIEVASITETAPFHEGSYKLEMIEEEPVVFVEDAVIVEEVVPEEIIIVEESVKEPIASSYHTKTPLKEEVKKEEPKKKSNWWWWWLLLLLLLLLFLLFGKKCSHKETAVDTEVVPFTAIEKVDIHEPYWDKKIADATVTEDGEIVYAKDGSLIGIIINDQTIDFDKWSTEAEVYNFLSSSSKESGWIVLDKVHFKFNKIDFTPEAQSQISNVVAILNKYAPDAKIDIEGFSDHLGSARENQIVSEERAIATKAQFVKDGLAESKIASAVGLSDTKRLCQADDTPLCRAQNRRVEIKITK